MVTREEIRGNWNQIKNRLQEHWAQLTEDDLRQLQGSAEQLIGRVQQKTGASRREVEQFLDNTIREVSGFAERAGHTVSQVAGDASRTIRHNADYAGERAQDLGAELMEAARRRPGQSLAIAFGVGIAAGLMLCTSYRRR
jgi:uncharacterized protein YjbJ (UPF0337 family)